MAPRLHQGIMAASLGADLISHLWNPQHVQQKRNRCPPGSSPGNAPENIKVSTIYVVIGGFSDPNGLQEELWVCEIRNEHFTSNGFEFPFDHLRNCRSPGTFTCKSFYTELCRNDDKTSTPKRVERMPLPSWLYAAQKRCTVAPFSQIAAGYELRLFHSLPPKSSGVPYQLLCRCGDTTKGQSL
ncbi:hypothetical protein F2P81_005285 [Scophthalmus maximus]|uniref:Uncharacterized protein n=1 Tax=Scophthalmus maximus TaxID=52904 RepID=A0A6A4T6V2_SCOMX|nr:hypothetical protein F2P81_005285 [Scophthalmus maximus]